MNASASALAIDGIALVNPVPVLASTPEFIAGSQKRRIVEVRGRRFDRQPIRSPLINPGDDLAELADELTYVHRLEGDILVISESVVAISQGRVYREDEIEVGPWAEFLWRFVRKVPYGIGLRSPQTMQCAIDECGLPRILLAAAVGAIGKLFGRRGDFYRVAGMQAATIDAASTSPIPQYNNSIILGPRDPRGTAAEIARKVGLPVAIVDVNDIGGSWVLGASEGIDRSLLEDILRDNPLGQGDELTPFGLVRPA